MFEIIISLLYIVGLAVGIFFGVKFLIREWKFSREVTTKNYINLQRIADALDRKEDK